MLDFDVACSVAPPSVKKKFIAPQAVQLRIHGPDLFSKPLVEFSCNLPAYQIGHLSGTSSRRQIGRIG